MKRCVLARAGIAVAMLWMLAVAAPAMAQAMKVAAESIPMPTDEKPHPLTEVRYGTTWAVEFNSIRLDITSQPGADKVEAQWTVTGVNSRSRPTRAQLTVILLDHDGKTVSSVKKALMVKPGGEPYEYVLETKVKQKDWELAERVKLQANFFIAS